MKYDTVMGQRFLRGGRKQVKQGHTGMCRTVPKNKLPRMSDSVRPLSESISHVYDRIHEREGLRAIEQVGLDELLKYLED